MNELHSSILTSTLSVTIGELEGLKRWGTLEGLEALENRFKSILSARCLEERHGRTRRLQQGEKNQFGAGYLEDLVMIYRK